MDKDAQTLDEAFNPGDIVRNIASHIWSIDNGRDRIEVQAGDMFIVGHYIDSRYIELHHMSGHKCRAYVFGYMWEHPHKYLELCET